MSELVSNYRTKVQIPVSAMTVVPSSGITIVLQTVTTTYRSEDRRRVWISSHANVSIQQGKVHSTWIFWKLHGVSNRNHVTAVNLWHLREGWVPYQNGVKYQYSFKEGRGEKSSPLHPSNICLKMLLKTSQSWWIPSNVLWKDNLLCWLSVWSFQTCKSLLETDNWKLNWI